jgi:DNA-binding response OmpR family regulator
MNKILIVEDDTFLLKMLSKESVQKGFSIEIAVNGEEAYEKIKSGNFDLVLLDLLLPKLHGLDLLRKLKGENNVTPIIVLSNLYDQESINTAMSLGVKEYIIKAQNTPENIIQKVKTFLLKK